MSNKTVFVDGIGRTILGEVVSENDIALQVKNPAMVIVQQVPSPVQNQQPQLQVQLMPLFFQEFIDPKKRENGTVFEYIKANIARVVQLDLDEKILAHYNRIFNQSSIITPNVETPVIRLFED